VLISPKELELPEYFKKNVVEKNGMAFTETDSLESAMPELDILYMTRIQEERFDDRAEYERLKGCYVLDPEKLKTAKSDMIILHPLPRVDEITVAVDADPRACYFKQVANGKNGRKALILKLLEEAENNPSRVCENREKVEIDRCPNHRCISNSERELKPLAVKTSDDGSLHCAYCEATV
jgi:aspartate carbamoyltransferase catalytic subunit